MGERFAASLCAQHPLAAPRWLELTAVPAPVPGQPPEKPTERPKTRGEAWNAASMGAERFQEARLGFGWIFFNVQPVLWLNRIS